MVMCFTSFILRFNKGQLNHALKNWPKDEAFDLYLSSAFGELFGWLQFARAQMECEQPKEG